MCDLMYCLAVFQPFRINCSFISPKDKKKKKKKLAEKAVKVQTSMFLLVLFSFLLYTLELLSKPVSALKTPDVEIRLL